MVGKPGTVHSGKSNDGKKRKYLEVIATSV
jgi:hypothetical protein